MWDIILWSQLIYFLHGLDLVIYAVRDYLLMLYSIPEYSNWTFYNIIKM
jgi:hypothetical protein